MKQSQRFLEGEAAAWLIRNKDKLPVENDHVLQAIESAKLALKSVLEVGCADGWRLELLKEKYGCQIAGVDPGAAEHYPLQTHWIRKGEAYQLDFSDDRFDVVIYGFCLYLCDREDLFGIVYEGDRVLQDGGYLIVYDFHSDNPHSRKYSHLEGIKSFKMDYAALWLANPAYSVRARYMYDSGDDQTSVTILQKSVAAGWPLHE